MSNAACHKAFEAEYIGRTGSRGFTGAILRTASQALEVVLSWQERAQQRHALANLDGRAMKDMGLVRSEVQRELRKPFWRA